MSVIGSSKTSKAQVCTLLKLILRSAWSESNHKSMTLQFRSFLTCWFECRRGELEELEREHR